MTDVTTDKFLGGRAVIRQPGRGFRAGLDAVMLAAAVPIRRDEAALELGSGVGTASLCLVTRISGCRVTGVEIDPALVALAAENARANGLADRTDFVASDVLALPRGLRREFTHVFANPPFHGDEERASPDTSRARATHDRGALNAWLRAGLKRTGPRGTFTVIIRADRLGEVLEAAAQHAATIFPLWPHAGEAAKRVVIRIRKGVQPTTTVLSGLVLHEEGGRYTPEADAILRGEQGLDFSTR